MKRNHRWNEINGLLDGKEIFLLGGGTSLTGFDLSRLNGRRVLAINHSSIIQIPGDCFSVTKYF